MNNLVFVFPGPQPSKADVAEVARKPALPVKFVTVLDGEAAWEEYQRRMGETEQVFYTPGVSPNFWEFFDRETVTLVGGELMPE